MYFLKITVRLGHELTEEENEVFKKMLEKYSIPKNNVIDISQEGKYALLCSQVHLSVYNCHAMCKAN